jgi:hypothetical protein
LYYCTYFQSQQQQQQQQQQQYSMNTVSFAVPIAPSAQQVIPESTAAASSSSKVYNHNTSHGVKEGVVGTITFLGDKSILVHFGWGLVTVVQEQGQSLPPTTTSSTFTDSSRSSGIGSSANIAMGPLVIAMPPKNYQGAFSENISTNQRSSSSSSSISVLLPCTDSETMQNQQIANHTADRLAQRLGVSVMVSCDLVQSSSSAGRGGRYGNNHAARDDTDDVEPAPIRNARAAALAEKEIQGIVQQHLLSLSKTPSS